MTEFFTQAPLLTPAQLGIYLNDPAINVERAAQMIDRAQKLCSTIIAPLPDAAVVVVERVAGRAYTSTTTPRAKQIEATGSPFGVTGSADGGVWLSSRDEQDLRRLNGSGGVGVFSVDMLPAGYVAPAPAWLVDGFDRYP